MPQMFSRYIRPKNDMRLKQGVNRLVQLIVNKEADLDQLKSAIGSLEFTL